MGNELSKAAVRRANDWRYANRWFVGKGLDIGCGYDVMPVSGNVTSVRGYDHVWGDKDAETLPELSNNEFDFVVSSHCLEHMRNPSHAMTHWLRVLKPGGFITVTVPEWELYEHKYWPSHFNGDHKSSWTLRGEFLPLHTIYVPDFISQFRVDIEMLQLLTEHYDEKAGPDLDQTGGPAECAIEFVLRKI